MSSAARRVWTNDTFRHIALSETMANLPRGDVAFGMPSPPATETAANLTSKWTEHVPSKVRVDSNSVDFLNLNGGAAKIPKVSARVINSLVKRIKEKRMSPAPAEPSVVSVSKASTAGPSAPAQPPTFGHPSHKSTPLVEIIQNKFGNIGETETANRYHHYFSNRMNQGKTHTTVRETKASAGHAARSKTECVAEKEPFKLTKFKRVESKIKLQLQRPSC